MASQFASGKVPVLTRKLNASDSTAYLDSDVGITSGRLYLSNNLQEEWLSFSGVAASGSEYAYSGLVRGLSQTADPSTAGTGKTWLAGQQCALVEMHDQMMNKQRPEPKIFATTAARDSAFGADGAATSPWVNVYVTATGLHYNYNLSTNQWEAIDTGTVTPNASDTVAGKVEKATQAEVNAGTDAGGTGALLAVIPSTFQWGVTALIASQAVAEAGASNAALMTPLRSAQFLAANMASDVTARTATDEQKYVNSKQAGYTVRALDSLSSLTTVGVAPTERGDTSGNYVKLKEMTAQYTGTYRITFSLKSLDSGFTVKGRIYKNDVAFGTERSTSSDVYTAYTEDLAFTAADKIQIYCQSNGATHAVRVKDMEVELNLVPNLYALTIDVD